LTTLDPHQIEMNSLKTYASHQSSKKPRVGIIGGGIGGLMSACLLATDGYEVHLFEKNSDLGGKMGEYTKEGFRFDTGPSLLTMPFLLERFFKTCGTTLENTLELVPVEPICRYNYPDGTLFDCFENEELSAKEIERIAPEDSKAYQDFLAYISKLYDKTSDAFLYNPLDSLSDLKGLSIQSFFAIDAFTSVSSVIDKKFRSEYLRLFFKRFTTYNGSSPYLAPGTLNVIPHVELNIGGYYIKGGMRRLVDQLIHLATHLGVVVHTECDIQKIVTHKSMGKIKVHALQVASRTPIEATDRVEHSNSENNPYLFECDVVVSNSDAYETYQKLLDRSSISYFNHIQTEKSEPSCSGFVLFLGLNRSYPQLKHHNIFFSEDYQKEFEDIFNNKVLPKDPTIYVANTSHTDPNHAPGDGSNLFVLVNAPYLTQEQELLEREHYADMIIDHLESRGLHDLRNHIVVKHIRTPYYFYQKYRSNKGSIYGTSSNGLFSAFLRPRNRTRGIKGLFHTGGSVHPGGGIPLVLQSAFNVQMLVQRYHD
jgi:phytoene desaturase